MDKKAFVDKFQIPLFCNWDGCRIMYGDHYVQGESTVIAGMRLKHPSPEGMMNHVHFKHVDSSTILAGGLDKQKHGS